MYALLCPQYRILSIATFDYPLCWLGAAIRWGVLVESVQVQSVNICYGVAIDKIFNRFMSNQKMYSPRIDFILNSGAASSIRWVGRIAYSVFNGEHTIPPP